MEKIWEIFRYNWADLSSDQRIILSLVVLICVCLVALAFSMLLQVAKKLDWARSETKTTSMGLRKSINRLAQVDYYREEARTAHTD